MAEQQIKIDVAERWAAIVLEKFGKALDKYHIGVTRDLLNSFHSELKKSGGDVDAVIFKFLKYGRFRDMGVGKGFDLNGAITHRQFDRYRDTRGRMTAGPPRSKAPWYSKTFFKEVAKLKALYQEQYGQDFLNVMETGLAGTVNLPH